MNDQPHDEEEEESQLTARGPGYFCGSNLTDGSGDTCKNRAGKGTDHLGFGQCRKHGGNTPSAIKYAERLQVLSTIEKYEGPGATGDPQEALIEEIRRAGAIVAWLDIVVKDIDVDHEYVKKHERERVHLARACKMALDAGIDERRVRVAETQVRQMAEVIRRVFGDERLQLTAEQRILVPAIVREHLQAIG